MPWTTPTLRQTREMIRDDITASLYGAAFIGNNVLRVMADAMAGLAHLTLRYIDWLSLQLLPDTAETEWLDRHGDIWLVNSDNTVGRKMATYAEGSAYFSGPTGGVIIPAGTTLEANGIGYETLTQGVTADNAALVDIPIRALDPGLVSNLPTGSTLSVEPALPGIDSDAEVITLTGGTDIENDDDLRMRVLQRIRQPPMGGAAHDYVRWALSVPGCTRAWCSPLEMGIGTVSVRVMFDDVRASTGGFPFAEDLEAVRLYMDQVRPVAVKDFWVLSPIPQRVDVHIDNLNPDTSEIRAAIQTSLIEMLFEMGAPGQTIYGTWKAQAIMNTPGVISCDLTDWSDDVMLSAGHLAVLGDVDYGE
jgi:uncharacterized phage protein gp47/JayE